MKFKTQGTGLSFSKHRKKKQTPFERLFEIFKELITHTSGDFDEAIDWLRELDKEYKLTDDNYTIDDFINDLLQKSYIKRNEDSGKGKGNGNEMRLTPKTEKLLREHALKQIFGKLKKSSSGNHNTKKIGQGEDNTGEFKAYQFGDSIEKIDMTQSFKNAQIRSVGNNFTLQHDDLVVEDNFFKTQMSTILMIDISHSMILYGEDRITPAKKVAMALAEMITTRYPKDTLDILVFGNDAWPISLKEVPYLEVGPYHTNTVAGLEFTSGPIQVGLAWSISLLSLIALVRFDRAARGNGWYAKEKETYVGMMDLYSKAQAKHYEYVELRAAAEAQEILEKYPQLDKEKSKRSSNA